MHQLPLYWTDSVLKFSQVDWRIKFDETFALIENSSYLSVVFDIIEFSKCSECSQCQEFFCANGLCVLDSQHCDNSNDCGDNSDEKGCFLCRDTGLLIPPHLVCDGISQCADASDESDCPGMIPFITFVEHPDSVNNCSVLLNFLNSFAQILWRVQHVVWLGLQLQRVTRDTKERVSVKWLRRCLCSPLREKTLQYTFWVGTMGCEFSEYWYFCSNPVLSRKIGEGFEKFCKIKKALALISQPEFPIFRNPFCT